MDESSRQGGQWWLSLHRHWTKFGKSAEECQTIYTGHKSNDSDPNSNNGQNIIRQAALKILIWSRAIPVQSSLLDLNS